MTGTTGCPIRVFSGKEKLEVLVFAIFMLLIFPFLSSLHLFIIALALTLASGTIFRDSTGKYYHLFLAATILLLISIAAGQSGYFFPEYIIIQALEISTIGLLVATGVKEKGNIPENRKYLPSSICLLLAGGTAAAVAGVWYAYLHIGTDYEMIFFVSVIGAINAALFESIPSNFNRTLSTTLGSAMAMWVLASFGFEVPTEQLLFAFAFSLILGYLAYRVNIADISAVMSATLMGVLIIVFSNIFWFVLLLTFFILGGMFTKYRYQYKLSKGIAQDQGGIRSYENVFSNSTAALVLAMAYGIYPQHSEVISYAFLGTVATAAADTLASEIGTTSNRTPRMITTLKPVKTGTDGGITVLGELAAIGGACVIAVLALAFGMTENIGYAILITCAGGFVGTNADSLLGATFQKRGFLSNSGVNFIATFIGALFSGLLYLFLG